MITLKASFYMGSHNRCAYVDHLRIFITDHGYEKSCFFEELIKDPTSCIHISAPGVELQVCVAPALTAVQSQVPPQWTLAMNKSCSLLGDRCSFPVFQNSLWSNEIPEGKQDSRCALHICRTTAYANSF